MLLAIIGKLAGSAGLGTLVGLVGSWLQRRQDIKQMELEQAHELAMRDKDADLLKIEIAGAAQIAKVQADGARDVADAELQGRSYAADMATYSQNVQSGSKWGAVLIFVDVLRGTVRPLVTYYLVGFLSWMVWQFLRHVPLIDLLQLNPPLFWDVFEYTLATAVFLASTAVAWWFGARSKRMK